MTSVSASLSSLTVKELRQLVRESTSQRGVLSRLKKKQDLVDYLEERMQKSAAESRETHSSSEEESPQSLPTRVSETTQGKNTVNGSKATTTTTTTTVERRRSPALSMPPLTSSDDKDHGHVAAANGATVVVTDTPKASRKDAVFEQVFQRYPPVRDQPEVEYTPPASDVRQLHHPIFKHNNVTCDMDIIFVGTASCTPGVTRGVSCTALRLNWGRRAAFLDPSTGRTEQVSSFQGGTWLFDVGECTQVSQAVFAFFRMCVCFAFLRRLKLFCT